MRKKFDYIMDIGEQMLICGAEVHRVEDSVNRMCAAFGAGASLRYRGGRSKGRMPDLG